MKTAIQVKRILEVTITEQYQVNQLAQMLTPITLNLIRLFYPSLKRVMERQDLEQICFIELAKCAQRYVNGELEGDFKAYYKTCAGRKLLAQVRKFRQHNNRANLEATSLDKELAFQTHLYGIDMIENNIPEYDAVYGMYAVLFEEVAEEVNKQLDKEEVQIFEFYKLGYSYREIAIEMNVTTKKVDNTIQKVRKLYRPLID